MPFILASGIVATALQDASTQRPVRSCLDVQVDPRVPPRTIELRDPVTGGLVGTIINIDFAPTSEDAPGRAGTETP